MDDHESITVRFIEMTGLTRSEAMEFLDATNWVPIEEAAHIFFNEFSDNRREIEPEEERGWPYVEYDNRSGRRNDAGYYTSSDSSLSDNDDAADLEALLDTSPMEFESAGDGYDGETPITPAGQVQQRRIRARSLEHLSPSEILGQELMESSIQESTDQPEERFNRAPSLLKFHGNSQAAKAHAQKKGKWLLASIQSTNFESYQLNWNVWSKGEIREILNEHFVFWQISDHVEGRKMADSYKIKKMPAVLIIDPYTFNKMDHLEGRVDLQTLIEILSLYTEKGPVENIKNSTTPSSSDFAVPSNRPSPTVIEYPTLPQEPERGTPGAVNIAIRLPDGRRIHRKFLATEPIQVLWSFAAPEIPENKVFELICPITGVELKYDDRKNIEEAGVADSLLILVFKN